MPSPGRSGVPYPGDACFHWRGESGVPSPGGEGLVCPLQEGRVWCALSRRGGSGVPSPGGEGLVCPLQEGRVWCALSRRGESGVTSPPNVFTRGVALVNTKLYLVSSKSYEEVASG